MPDLILGELMEFGLLNDTDTDKAYSIIEWRVKYLLSRGIRQYLYPYPPKDVYQERQKSGFNFALYDGGEIAGIVTLIPDHVHEGWKEYFPSEHYLWISSLFVAEEYRGRSIGEEILKRAEKFASGRNCRILFLDCYLGDGFLKNYYGRNGFHEICRKTFQLPDREYEAVLMRKDI